MPKEILPDQCTEFLEVGPYAQDKSLVEEFRALLRQETIDKLAELVDPVSSLKHIFLRFRELRTQTQTIHQQILELNSLRPGMQSKLARQKGDTNANQRKIRRWINYLVSAENFIPGQVPLSDFELSGVDFRWVQDPSGLDEDEICLYALDVLQFATLHAAGKLFKIIHNSL